MQKLELLQLGGGPERRWQLTVALNREGPRAALGGFAEWGFMECSCEPRARPDACFREQTHTVMSVLTRRIEAAKTPENELLKFWCGDALQIRNRDR